MGVLSSRTTTKTTRAFRTIGEASEELGLQPHVLRFWESKFSQIQPMKRAGGRRFYRPEDIEFIRGIKTLLHDEKHPIKDVQKLIKRNGAQSVVDLGRSVEAASRERAVKDTVLVPQRILQDDPTPATPAAPAAAAAVEQPSVPQVVAASIPLPVENAVDPQAPAAPESAPAEPIRSSLVSSVTFEPEIDRDSLVDALGQLDALRARWAKFLDTDATKDG